MVSDSEIPQHELFPRENRGDPWSLCCCSVLFCSRLGLEHRCSATSCFGQQGQRRSIQGHPIEVKASTLQYWREANQRHCAGKVLCFILAQVVKSEVCWNLFLASTEGRLVIVAG